MLAVQHLPPCDRSNGVVPTGAAYRRAPGLAPPRITPRKRFAFAPTTLPGIDMTVAGASSGTNVHEIIDGICRINTPTDTAPGGFSFNQYLVLDDQPVMFHTGLRKMFYQHHIVTVSRARSAPTLITYSGYSGAISASNFKIISGKTGIGFVAVN
jgi:hypothetical protein